MSNKANVDALTRILADLVASDAVDGGAVRHRRRRLDAASVPQGCANLPVAPSPAPPADRAPTVPWHAKQAFRLFAEREAVMGRRWMRP